MNRRNFLQSALAVAVTAALTSLPALASTTVPTRARGTKILSVKDFGAVGDGKHDDTYAINKTIKALPSTGGTVFIPAGTYMINTGTAIVLRSLMLLQLDPAATLKAIPTSKAVQQVVWVANVSDIEIAGGQIIGERAGHIYNDPTSTDEWGMGIQLHTAKRVTIRDIRVSDCTGDGILIGYNSQDAVVSNVVCTNCRRQGMSITWSTGVKVYDSEFSYTNGTAPQCGIDIEPGNRGSSDTLIQNCKFHHNSSRGINVWKNTQSVVINSCEFYNNRLQGIATTGCLSATLSNNLVHDNGGVGVSMLKGSKNVTVQGNTCWGNNGEGSRTPFCLVGTSKKTRNDINAVSETSGISILSNCYK